MKAIFRRLHGTGGAVLAKDLTLNKRSPLRWLRAVAMLCLLSLYPAISGWLNEGTLEFNIGMNVSLACILGFVLLGEVVVNAFSAELGRIRILLSAPIPKWKIMIAKLFAYGLPTVLLCEVTVLILDLASGVPLVAIVYSVTLTALIAAGMTAVLVGMGALAAKPDAYSRGSMDEFMAEEVFFTNPSSFLVFLLGILAVGLNVVLAMTPWVLQTQGLALGPASLLLTVLLILEANMLVGLLSLLFGSRCLDQLHR